MINQSILIPMAVKTLTRASDSASIPVIPGIIMSAQAQGTGTLLKVRNERGDITPVVVTEAVATVVNGTTLFLVTPSSGAKYIRAETVADFADARGGTLLQLLSDDNGQDHGASLLVTESVATIQGRIDAAIIAGGGGGGGGSFGSITATGATQGTAAAITTSVVRITAGAADTGVQLTTATGAEETYVHNATTTNKFVYPASGEFIDPMLVNQGFAIGPNEAVLFKCTLAGHWVTEVQISNTQSVAASGTIQGGGQIKEGVTNAIITGVAFGNTAATLPAGLPGARISVQQLGGSTAGRLYPATGEQINAGGVNTFINMKADSTMELICNQSGLWVDAASSVKNLVVDAIQTRTSTGTVTVETSAGTDIARFSAALVDLDVPLALSYLEGTAIAGGNQSAALAATANLVNIIVSATLGDAVVLSSLATTCTLVNNGVAACYVYCDLGSTINGVTNGYVIVAPGQTWYFDGQGTASPFAWTGSLLNSGPGEYIALAGVTRPHIVHPNATITTVAAPLDEVILDDQQQTVILVNAGANTALLLPPATQFLNGGASIQLPARSVIHVQKTAAGQWVGNFLSPGVQSGVAFAGGGQASGTPVVSSAVIATTVAVANDSFTIQFTSPRQIVFANDGANSLNLFPPVGGQIDALGVNNAFAIAATARVMLLSNDGFVWVSHVL